MSHSNLSNRFLKILLTFCLGSIVLGLVVMFLPLPLAHAAPRGIVTVTNTNDSGAGSLRDEITSANPGDTIVFSLTLPATITLSSQLVINKNLSILGPGASLLTIDGNNSVRILNIYGGSTVNFSDITFSNGIQTAQYSYGGAIANFGILSITNTNFISNSAYTGGAIHNEGTMIIVSSAFTKNIGTSTDYTGNYGGGAIEIRFGSATISATTFDNNVAATGGGIFLIFGSLGIDSSTFYSNTAVGLGAGGIFGNGTVTVTKSTFFKNHAPSGCGGALYPQQALTIINSTFTENDAFCGGAINGALWITNSTFFGNSGNGGSGGAIGPGGARLYNTIIANSPSGGNCSGSITNGGNNIDDGTTCGWSSSNGSMSNMNPLLGSLANNGGATQTMALLPGSPAINGVIYNAPNGCPSADQRGIFRPQAGICDIGAYEVVSGTLIFMPLIFR